MHLESLAKRPTQTKKKMLNLLWCLLSSLVEDRDICMELFSNASSILNTIPNNNLKYLQKKFYLQTALKNTTADTIVSSQKSALEERETLRINNELPCSIVRNKARVTFKSLGLKKYEEKLSKYQKCMAEQKKTLDQIDSYNMNKTNCNKDCNNHANSCLERLTCGVRNIIDRTGFIIDNLTQQVLSGNYVDNKTKKIDWSQCPKNKVVTKQPTSMMSEQAVKNDFFCPNPCDISLTKKDVRETTKCSKNKSFNNNLNNIDKSEYKKRLLLSLLKNLKLKQALIKVKESKTKTTQNRATDVFEVGYQCSQQSSVISVGAGSESLEKSANEYCGENEIWVNGEFKGFVENS